jgi:hypothetical protein
LSESNTFEVDPFAPESMNASITAVISDQVQDWMEVERPAVRSEVRNLHDNGGPAGLRRTLKRLKQSLEGCQPDQSSAITRVRIEEIEKLLPPEKQGYILVRACDIEFTKPDFILDGFIERDSTCELFGDSESGKSFLAIDWSCSIASGQPWNGKKTKQVPVVYVAAEGQRGIPRRLAAWCKARSFPIADLPVYFLLHAAQLIEPESVDALISGIKQIANTQGIPGMVVLDTLARNIGGDENSSIDMNKFINACDRIRETWHCAILIIHHTGLTAKERARGHSALKAALDTEFRTDIDETKTVRLVNTKNKDSLPVTPLAFRFKQIAMDVLDDDGGEIFSAVLEPTSYEPPIKAGTEGRGKWQTVALETLANIETHQRENLERAGHDPDTARVTLEDWRTACLSAGIPRTHFYKLQESLKKARSVIIELGFVSLYPSLRKGYKGYTSKNPKVDKEYANDTQKIQEGYTEKKEDSDEGYF